MQFLHPETLIQTCKITRETTPPDSIGRYLKRPFFYLDVWYQRTLGVRLTSMATDNREQNTDHNLAAIARMAAIIFIS